MVIAIVVLLFADKCLCRQTIFLSNARMYVKMVKLGDGSKKLYFSLRLLPLMFNSDNIDYIILKDYYGGDEYIFVQNDSLILFPIESYTQLDNKERYHYTDYKEVNFSIERFSTYFPYIWVETNPDGSEDRVVHWGSEGKPERFYDGQELRNDYSIIRYYSGWRGTGISGGKNGQKAHIWNLLRRPRRL